MSLIPLLLIPLLVAGVVRAVKGESLTWREILLLEGIMAVLLTGGFMLARYGALQDTEVWSGRIVGKPDGTQSCCHCRTECDTCTSTDANGNVTTSSCNCRMVCDHSQDYWWALDVSTGDRITVDDCEPRRSRVPQIWIDARIGEPAVVPHRYTNYLLADPESVLIQSGAKATAPLPSYPQVYSLYRMRRAMGQGTGLNEVAWSAALDELNADLGAGKQVNVMVVATRSADPMYAKALEQTWLYGKKNDLIFVLGVPDGVTVEWADVVAISRVEMLRSVAKDELRGLSLRDVDGGVSRIRALVVEHFRRTPMAEFEYLSSAAKPSLVGLTILYLLGIGLSVAGAIWLSQNDLFREERYSSPIHRRSRGRRF